MMTFFYSRLDILLATIDRSIPSIKASQPANQPTRFANIGYAAPIWFQTSV
jgi:hypothetical protein